MVLESTISQHQLDQPPQGARRRLLEDLGERLDLRFQTVRGGDGVERRIGTNSRAVNVYLEDETGQWDSRDGEVWVRRGSNGRHIWRGTVRFDADNNYITVGTDSGVTYSTRQDGSWTASIVTGGGVRYEVTYGRDGNPTGCRTGNLVYTSADGGNTWTEVASGQVYRGRCGIDPYGQYWEHPQGGDRRIVTRASELDRVERRQRQLTERYGVIFPRPGEVVQYSNQPYTTRPPTIAELDCLEDVLRRNGQMNLRGLRFCFVQATRSTDNLSLWGVYQRQGNEGNPQVLLMPSATRTIRGWNALEGTIEHEIVHHEQYNLWGRHEWGSAQSPLFTRELLREMGWVYDAASGQSRILDRESNQWQYNYTAGRWEQVVGGHPDPRRTLTSAELRERAQVRPSTEYFTTPGEMHAEGLSMFRMDRRMLFDQNSRMYEIIKRWDQQLIDARYGTHNGQPRMIRAIDGSIVPNIEPNRRAVAETEAQWSSAFRPPPGFCQVRPMCCSMNA